jgi:hypothetical protein
MIKVSLLILLTVCNLQGEDLVSELVRKDISNERRDAIVEQLKQSDISAVAPKILEVMRSHESAGEPGIPPKPWMNDSHSHRAKVWYASAEIWFWLFIGRDDPNKAAILPKLLTSINDAYKDDGYTIHEVLSTMLAHWAPEAEQQVSNLLQDSKAPSSVKRHALEVLIQRCGERYVIPAIDFIRSSSGRDQKMLFTSIFNSGGYFKYSEENQKNIIDLGFSILESNENQYGYGLARQLGYFLKIPGEFAPNQNAAKYKTKNGLNLNDQFFLDTVRNALEWRKRNSEPQK